MIFGDIQPCILFAISRHVTSLCSFVKPPKEVFHRSKKERNQCLFSNGSSLLSSPPSPG